MRLRFLLICMLFLAYAPTPLCAQKPRMVVNLETHDTVYISSYGDTINPSSLYRRFIQWRTNAQLKGYDSAYVAFPENHPWLVKVSASTGGLSQSIDLPTIFEDEPFDFYSVSNSGIRLKPTVGLYFRGWGLAVGPSLISKWTSIDLSIVQPRFGLELKFDALGSIKNRVMLYQNGELVHEDVRRLITQLSPSDIGSFIQSKLTSRFSFLSGSAHYSFNSRHYSVPAAWKQSIWQTKSAGGVIVMARYNYSFNTYNSSSLANYFLADTFTVNIHSIMLGAGYGYNWVFHNGKVMFGAIVIPMLNCALPAKLRLTPVDFSQFGQDPIKLRLYEELYESSRKELNEAFSRPSFSWAAQTRLSLFWNISERWVLGTFGNLSNYHYKNNTLKQNSFDWSVSLYCGYRFNIHVAALWKKKRKAPQECLN